jgi:hypothetical protein
MPMRRYIPEHDFEDTAGRHPAAWLREHGHSGNLVWKSSDQTVDFGNAGGVLN